MFPFTAHFHRPTPSGSVFPHTTPLKKSISAPLTTTFPLPAPKSYVYPVSVRQTSLSAQLPARSAGTGPPVGQPGAGVAGGEVLAGAEAHALVETVGSGLGGGDDCAVGMA